MNISRLDSSMPAGNLSSSFEIDDRSNERQRSSRFQTIRRIPKRWLIGAVVFYCASVLTVGLLVGLIPRRTQYITVVGTSTESSTESPVTTQQTTPAIGSSTSTISTCTVSPVTTASPRVTTTTKTMITTTAKPSNGTCTGDACNPRLSSHVSVNSYELKFRYDDVQQSSIQGTVTIDFTLKESVEQLIYHAKRMQKLYEPTLFEGNVNRLVSMETYTPNDYVILRLKNGGKFPSSNYRIVQSFVVNLVDDNVGFYQSTFLNEDGSKKSVTNIVQSYE
jgi:hypothetical protein